MDSPSDNWKQTTKLHEQVERGEITVKYLLELLSHEDAIMRARAVTVLGRLHEKSAIEPFKSLLEMDDDKTVRVSAAVALAEMSITIQPLIQLLDDEDTIIRLKAVQSFVRIPNRVNNKDAIVLLLRCLEDDYFPIRERAANALGELRYVQAINPLIKHLQSDEDFDVRSTAASSLGKLKAMEAFPMLITALEDKSPAVRGSAADALGKLGKPEAIEPLSKLLTDRDFEHYFDFPGQFVCEYVAEALKAIGTRKARSALKGYNPPKLW
jgi:HEAT repeat protein